MAKKEESVVEIRNIKKTSLRIKIVGDSDLILCKKARSYEREEIFKQSHPKGTKIPAELKQPYNLFEKLITSVTWDRPIEQFDDYSKYTEEMWEDLVKNNRPCILAKAFSDSFAEGFISLGYKDMTSRTGADFKRTFNVENGKCPVDIVTAEYDQHLTPNNSVSHTNVLTQHNIFHGWSCEITVTFIDYVFPKETVIELINNCGSFLGIGSRRGEGYGRYHIEEVSELV
jgi:hypothetical protein